MKKTFSLVFALILVLALVSCGGGADAAQQIKAAFTVPFEYSVSTPSFGFDYAKTSESAVMVLNTPDTLKGLTVTRDKDGVTASYDGIVVTLPEITVKKLTSLDMLADKIAAAIDAGEYTLSEENGATVLTFSSGDDVFTVTCGEDGVITGAKATVAGKTYEFAFLH